MGVDLRGGPGGEGVHRAVALGGRPGGGGRLQRVRSHQLHVLRRVARRRGVHRGDCPADELRPRRHARGQAPADPGADGQPPGGAARRGGPAGRELRGRGPRPGEHAPGAGGPGPLRQGRASSRADLSGTSFREASFALCDLSHAKIDRAADLRGADLEGANLHRVVREGAALDGARIKDARPHRPRARPRRGLQTPSSEMEPPDADPETSPNSRRPTATCREGCASSISWRCRPRPRVAELSANPQRPGRGPGERGAAPAGGIREAPPPHPCCARTSAARPRPRWRSPPCPDKYAVESPAIDLRGPPPPVQGRAAAPSRSCSRVQDLDERVVRWDYARPYRIAARDDGTCVHLEGGACSVHDRRPAACRAYDCRRDRRVWLDFDKWIPRTLTR